MSNICRCCGLITHTVTKNGECLICERTRKCPKCTYRMSCSYGYWYCSKCEPILWRITQKPVGEIWMREIEETSESEKVLDTFAEECQYLATRSYSQKTTLTLWQQRIQSDGSRTWEKYREATFQSEFRTRRK